MTDYFAKTPKPYDYAAFIDELREHIAEAEAIPASDRIWDADAFVRWKLAVDDSLKRARREKFPIDTGAARRSFRIFDSDFGVASAQRQLLAFESDMRDTLAEFRLILKNSERYVHPTEQPAPPTDAQWAAMTLGRDSGNARIEPEPERRPLVLTDKMSVRWLIDNVPPKFWLAAGASFLMAFGGGMTLAGTKLGRAVLAWFSAGS